VFWKIITAICLTSPFILLWGWMKYFQSPIRSDWRSRASLVGLSSPIVSFVIWTATLAIALNKGWHTPNPAVQRFITVGVWIALIGMLIGLAGRPRLILAIVSGCIGVVLFWFGTTVP
jgi:hypothetical protein